MPFIEANDVTLYYELHGSGAPLLMISGTGNDLRYSMPDRHPLNKHFQVLHFDQRGLGQADKPSGRSEMSDYADDAAALVRAVGWEACYVVGTSFGGMVAQHVALRHPDLVRRLVLNCTSPGGSRPSFALHSIQDLDVEARLELMLGLLDSRWDPEADEPIPGYGPYYDAYIERARAPQSAEALAGKQSQLDARSRHDTERQLRTITAPTLVCAGTYDDLAPLENSEAIAAAIPGAKLRTFNGGHIFTLQDRTAFPTMVAFLNAELDTD